MSEFYSAFEMSPVPAPGPDAVAPDPYRGIYAMPAFVTIPTHDLEASTDFWVRGLGFIDLFDVPGQVVHLRRWAFQDVLLVAATAETATAGVPAMQVCFSGVLNQLDPVAAVCRALRPGSVTGPHDTLWNTRDVEVITPEGVRVVLTAAVTVLDPESAQGEYWASVGVLAPDTAGDGGNGARG